MERNNILIINSQKFHYEILETLFTLFLKKLGIKTDCNIYLLIFPNKEYETYIKSKYKNVFFVRTKPTDIVINIEIWATIYPEDLEKIKNSNRLSVKRYFISHRIDNDLKKIDNVFYLTPLSKNYKYILPTILPAITKIKSKIKTFCIQGNIKETRRNYKSLIPIFEDFKHKDFIIKFIGRGTLPKYLEKYKEKIKTECNHSFLKYHDCFKDVDIILALVDDTFEHNYFKTQLTSSITYSIAYNIPIIYHKKLHNIYNLKNSLVYNDEKEFKERFKQIID